jgi:transketolase C-terminal domain/subunit
MTGQGFRIGLVGLGRMGANMARRLLNHGHEIVAYDRDPEAAAVARGDGAEATASLEELVAALDPPRAVWLILPAGKPTDDTIDSFPTSFIGWPSPTYTDSEYAHGSPLGEEEIRRTKEILELPPDEAFCVPDEVLDMYRDCIPRGQALRRQWEQRLREWKGDRDAYEACMSRRGLAAWEHALPTYEAGTRMATRVASGQCLKALVPVVPGLVAGGADLTGNTGTKIDGAERESASTPAGRQIYFGIREHAMGGLMNGMALHGGVLPVGGTFFNFSDYMRGAVRLAALSMAHVVYSWTHDSVGLGEDGPTHQPIEHLAAMRVMPNLCVIRPADANETSQAWELAITGDGPTALVLTRQDVAVLEGTSRPGQVARGAYVLIDADAPDVVLIGTGSEVALCVDAARILVRDGITARVVSMPSWELFAARPRITVPPSFRWPCRGLLSRQRPRSDGKGTRTHPCRSTASARPRPARSSWRTSALRPNTFRREHANSSRACRTACLRAFLARRREARGHDEPDATGGPRLDRRRSRRCDLALRPGRDDPDLESGLHPYLRMDE